MRDVCVTNTTYIVSVHYHRVNKMKYLFEDCEDEEEEKNVL